MSAGLLEDFPRCSKTSLDFILWKISYSFQAIDIHVIAVPENLQLTTISEQKGANENDLKAVANGGCGWNWTSDPCRVKAVLSP